MPRLNSALVLVLAFVLSSCSGGSQSVLPASGLHTQGHRTHVLQKIASLRQKKDGLGGIGNSPVNAWISDAPPLLGGQTPSEVDLGVLGIQAIDASGNYATLASFSSPRVVNLLDYQTTALAFDTVNIPAGTYAKVRVLVDISTSHVVLNGATLPINFDSMKSSSTAPTAQDTFTGQDTSGAVVMEVTAPFTVTDGVPASFHIDFNAAESLALDPDGTVYAQPALFASPQETSISGTIVNAMGRPVPNAVVTAEDSNGKVANLGVTGPYGRFHIHTIDAGTYRLRIYNQFVTTAGLSINAKGQSSTQASVAGPQVTTGGANLDLNVGSISD